MTPFGKVRAGQTLYVPFEAFAAAGGMTTISGLATSDIKIYKDGGTTERASASGFTLLDSDGIDFDGIQGINGFSIDLSDNTTADFYAAGSKYFIVIASITADGNTTNFLAGSFEIGEQGSFLDTTIATLSSQTSFTLTSGPAEDNALVGHQVVFHAAASAVQRAHGVISAYTGSTKTATLAAAPTFTIAAKTNVSVMGLAPLQPTVPGAAVNVGNLNTLSSHDPGATIGTGTSTLTQTQVTGGAYSVQSASCVLGDARITHLDADISSRGTSTLTQAQVTGGAYSMQSASCVLGDSRIAHLDADLSSRMATFSLPANFAALGITVGGKISGVVLADTVTTYTGNTPQTGDSFARLTGTGAVTFASLTVSGATTLTGAVSATNASNDVRGITPNGATALTESYAADGTAATHSQLMYMLYSALSEFVISGTTITCKKLDGSTTAMTYTLDSSTAPTSRTRVT